jgi:predicted DNA binding CopG/RHH family protein
MKRLPIGIQNFEELITGNYIYVDKTPHIYQLINNGKYYFLSRPRRFGKSLLLDTIKCLFEGKEHLFNKLFIHQHWNWNQSHPVIKISFASFKKTNTYNLEDFIYKRLKEIATFHNIHLNETEYYETFRELVIKLSKKNKVVVLIDEYDKPILDNIENTNIAKEYRETLKGFYQVIKDMDEYLQFVFLTGVSKFSKVSIFSGLNNLNDISIDTQFSSILGYTQSEVESYFGSMLEGVNMKKLKWWYNGFQWSGESVYNPFDILLFIDKGKKFQNYWFQTGTPTFLIKILLEKKFFIPELENITATELLLSSFDIDNINPLALLFQTGYLTIKQTIEYENLTQFILSYPNMEVKMALNDFILQYFTNLLDKDATKINILNSLIHANIEKIIQSFSSIFAGIPYQWYINNHLHEYEGFFASIFYSVFQALGLDVIPEDITNKGRIDLTVKINNNIFIFEFKTNPSPNNTIHSPLQQIKIKKYHEKYLQHNKNIFLIGIEFSKKDKNIINYEYEKIT